MAENNVNFDELLGQLRELGASTKEIDSLAFKFKTLEEHTQSWRDVVKDTKVRIEELKAESENLETPFKTLNKIIRDNARELSKTNDPVNLTKKALNRVAHITRDLVLDNQGITDLSERQLQKKLEQLEAQKQILKTNASETGYLSQEDVGLTGIIGKVKERLQLEKSINENLGVAGALIGGAGALMDRLGMRSGIFHSAMKDANEAMKDVARRMGDTVTFSNKIVTAWAGMKKLAIGFGKALLDPTAMVLKIVSILSEIDKKSVEFRRLTGQTANSMAVVSTEASSVVDLLETAAEFTKQTGLNSAAIFTPKQIGQISDAKNLLGLSVEQGTQLGLIMKQTGRSVESIEKGISQSTEAGVSQKVVYEDILSASEDIVASAGSNEKALARAASKARKLGLNLGKVNDIADGLLDFESSIESELEAQLLTGKAINLNKAREAALNNDLVTLTDELKKNGASAAEYAEMNRIQQQSLAKALGMSRQELGKMVLTEKALANMSEKKRAAARGVTLEQSRQMDIQTRLNKALFRLGEIFTPLISLVAGIVEPLSKLVNTFPDISTGILTAAVAMRIFGKRILNAVGGVKSLWKGLTKVLTKMNLIKAKDAILSKFTSKGKGKGKDALDQLTKKGGADKAKEVAKKSKGIPAGENIKKFLTNVGEGLKRMGNKEVLFGALNLIPASIGFIAMIPGAIGMAAIAALGKPTAVGLSALAKGLSTFGKAMMGPGGLGLLAFVGAAVGIGAAFALIGAGAMMFGKGIEFAANGIVTILDKIGSLTSLIPQMYLLGGALMSIAAGLGAIAVTGISAIPALAALSGFVLAATPIIALSGMFEGNEDSGENSEMIKLLKEIRDEVRDGGNVYLDGNKVGEALVLGSYISS